jgi:phosphoglycolate phosphatase
MAKNLLILWDIDGTILHSTGAGVTALRGAFTAVFGIEGSFEGIDFAGRTDKLIIRQIFSRYSIEYTPANFERFIDGYISALPQSLVECHARVLPGVADLLATAAGHPEVAQGLLTGNVRRGAEVKLGHHGLWQTFPIGAFADDGEHRSDLGPHALRRARDHWGVDFSPERVWVVGDTPHDISCARAFGARALAVATGGSRLPDLASHSPDAVLEDLRNPAAFWEAIGLGA